MLVGRLLQTSSLKYWRTTHCSLTAAVQITAMKHTLTVDKSKPSLYLRLVAENLKDSVTFKWDTVTALKVNNLSLHSPEAISRHLARANPEAGLYGSNLLQQAEVDHWIWFGLNKFGHGDFNSSIRYCDEVLAQNSFMVGSTLSLADLSVYSGLMSNHSFNVVLSKGLCGKNLTRWCDHISKLPAVVVSVADMPKITRGSDRKTEGKKAKGGKEEGGKFAELPGAKMGEVVVRFPPEASGYLHIGHAKAALLNQYYQQSFKGKLVMRFDDTNPAKENTEFENIILEDVKLLNIDYDIFSFTSNHFPAMLEYAEEMIQKGLAYVDDTDPAVMKEEREKREESANRSNSVSQNMEKWNEMKAGSEYGKKCCLRAKIDMKSDNGCMRDPAIYRCKDEPHPRHGNKHKVYPTYDFACPIVDSVEGVTHALRTTEYNDRDPQYYWFIDQLGLRRPHIYAYARLNLTHTVLSKRKLAWFVEQGLVSGWDDPRFPTVRGILRRGMTVEALKQFIILQGSARSVVQMGWDKIWTINKKIIDPIAPRFTGLAKSTLVPVNVLGVQKEVKKCAKHPKNAEIGEKDVYYGSKVYLEGEDAENLKPGEKITMINWGNMLVDHISRSDNKVTEVSLKPVLEDTDFKKTVKLTWLADVPDNIPAVAVHYDNIISKAVLGKDEDFKSYIGHQTVFETELIGDPSLGSLKKGDIIQLQRRGYYICDSPYQPSSEFTGLPMPCMLINIPDGRQQVPPTPAAASTPPSISTPVPSGNGDAILSQITEQGNTVRNLKSQKANKDEIKVAVDKLLALKKQYKDLTGVDPPPGGKPAAKPAAAASGNADNILAQIAEQGNAVRNLKSQKAGKDVIKEAVDKLLALKKQYKDLTGVDPPPGGKPAPKPAQSAAPTSGEADKLLEQIAEQGNAVRNLKSQKAGKDVIKGAVDKLLALKKQYKDLTGQDPPPGGKPAAKPAENSTPATKPAPVASGDADKILEQIAEQGNLVRNLKAEKAGKDKIKPAVDQLLALKKQYKDLTGADPPPGGKSAPKTTSSPDADKILEAIHEQGNVVRDLKSKKAPKDEITSAVQLLLKHKSDYKALTGKDAPPGGKAPSSAPVKTMPDTSVTPEQLESKIKEQGDKVRSAKGSGASKDEIQSLVSDLLKLKADYKTLTGNDPPGAPQQSSKQKKKEKKAPAPKVEAGVTRLGIEAKKFEDLPNWYSQVITKSEMIEYYDVSGCYILRPWSFFIWEVIQKWFDAGIKELGVENCYFPMFVSNSALEKEKTHIADFAPEVAWVTKSGDSELAEPIAIRPTSETVMYPSYASWVQSHRDLPIKLNQWCNVVRWEFKHPQPFLRTREFLWQEGHSAFATQEEAHKEVYDILDLYHGVYKELLAIPTVKGRKTEKEKFAGGDFTTTVEGYVSATGRGIQGATSHHLGQNFSKMFNIQFEDPDSNSGDKLFAHQNSWGLSTRSIGVVVMVHGDDKGLVLPPRVAMYQAVIVPCGVSDANKEQLNTHCSELKKTLHKAGIRTHADLRENYNSGWKFNHWELKGVPLRIEIGPRDIKNNQVVVVRRDTGVKATLQNENLEEQLKTLLDTVHEDMYNRALLERDANMAVTTVWEDFCQLLDQRKIIQAPYCGAIECEEIIKKDSARTEAVDDKAPAMGAKSLCIPFNQPADATTETCICPKCDKKANSYTLFGRSY